MKKVIELSKKEMDLEIIRLSLFKDNKRAVNLYKKFGFRKYGELPRARKKGNKYFNELQMYKEL